jgi:hypothetical protein
MVKQKPSLTYTDPWCILNFGGVRDVYEQNDLKIYRDYSLYICKSYVRELSYKCIVIYIATSCVGTGRYCNGSSLVLKKRLWET